MLQVAGGAGSSNRQHLCGVPDTSERDGFSCKPAMTVCSCPPRDGYHCPTLHVHDPLLSIGSIHRPLLCQQPTQSDVLGASHDCMPRLPCTLSGSELPIDYLDVPAATQGHRCGFLRRFARLACDAR